MPSAQQHAITRSRGAGHAVRAPSSRRRAHAKNTRNALKRASNHFKRPGRSAVARSPADPQPRARTFTQTMDSSPREHVLHAPHSVKRCFIVIYCSTFCSVSQSVLICLYFIQCDTHYPLGLGKRFLHPRSKPRGSPRTGLGAALRALPLAYSRMPLAETRTRSSVASNQHEQESHGCFTDLQTPFVPHILSYEPSKPIRMS